MRSPVVTAVCCILAPALSSVAQEYRATLAGEVTDPSGSAVDAARVTATSVDRNVIYESTTNSAGRYTIPFLLPGRYTLTVEKPGFNKFIEQSVSLLAADKPAID